MQIDINVKTYSTKQRILAFFMAFLIFTMTCPEIFEGWGLGLIARAVTPGTGIIGVTQTYSKYRVRLIKYKIRRLKHKNFGRLLILLLTHLF